MADSFRFKQFSLSNGRAALKVGTDAVLLGAAMTLLPEDRRALDIGTGTGVIALMAAQRAPLLSIEAIDIDGPSAEEAAYNFRQSPWPDRLRALHCSLSDYRPESGFDLIFSNPPYYDDSLRNPDERLSAARHSHALTLAEIFGFASERLTPDGRISLILPCEKRVPALRLAASFGFRPFRSILVKTVEHKAPKRVVLEFSRRKEVEKQEFITLMKDGGRSPEYARLTEGFYLDSSQIGRICHK